MERIYIDVKSSVGRINFREERIPYSLEDLINNMQYYRVHASLVFNNVAKDYSFSKGNRELLEQIKGNNRLYGVAAVIPDIQYELDEGYGYYDRLIEQGVRAFKLFPKAFNHGFDAFVIKSLADYMISKNVPLLLDIDGVDWKSIKEVVEMYDGLKVVLYGATWGHNRHLFRLMEKFSNLYFEISSNQSNDILKLCKKHFGIDRVLFGTDYPNKVMGGLKALIEYSELSEKEKDKVAYINAAELFRLDLKNIQPYGEDICQLDEIALKMDGGRPLDDILVIDSHTHMVDLRDKTVSQVPMLNGDEDSMIHKMDLLGIDRIITSPWEGITTNGMDANETSLKANRKYGHRIEAYATCNPNYSEDLNTVVDVYHKEYRFIGIKPYWPKHNYDLLGSKYEKWFEYGDRNRLIMLVHSGNFEIANKVLKLSERYKNMTFIMAHTGMSYEVARYNIEVAKKRDNVYLEITYTTLTNGIIEYLVEEVGAERVLFGSDMPMRDPAPQLAWVAYAKISVEEKKKILGGNILKLIDRCYT